MISNWKEDSMNPQALILTPKMTEMKGVHPLEVSLAKILQQGVRFQDFDTSIEGFL